MARGLTFSGGLIALIALTCCANAMVNDNCTASSCGNIHNISFPFRLSTDPENCGNRDYELSCENNRTVLNISSGKYYVQEISYNNYNIRIVDSRILKEDYYSYFTSPDYLYLYGYYGYNTYLRRRTKTGINSYAKLSRSLALMSCEKPVNSPLYLDTSTCNYNDSSSSISDSKRYRYVAVGITNISEVEDSCKVEKMFRTSWPRSDDSNISCEDVHNELVYGFELSWVEGLCDTYCGGDIYSCYLDDAKHVQCYDDGALLDRILHKLQVWSDSYKQANADWWYFLVRDARSLYEEPDFVDLSCEVSISKSFLKDSN